MDSISPILKTLINGSESRMDNLYLIALSTLHDILSVTRNIELKDTVISALVEDSSNTIGAILNNFHSPSNHPRVNFFFCKT
jgi:hypothetical protein